MCTLNIKNIFNKENEKINLKKNLEKTEPKFCSSFFPIMKFVIQIQGEKHVGVIVF